MSQLEHPHDEYELTSNGLAIALAPRGPNW